MSIERKDLQRLKTEIDFYADGGDLWYYSKYTDLWIKQDCMFFNEESQYLDNIMEDNFFEARKAFALGEEVEVQIYEGREWDTCAEEPMWYLGHKYRPKPIEEEEHEYECNWHTYGISGETIVDCNIWHNYEEKEEKNWFRFEPSKRIKK